MSFCLRVAVLMLLGSFTSAQQLPESSTDYRLTSYQDLILDSDVHRYYHNGIEDYMTLAEDPPRKQIIVGARDHVLRLSTSRLDELERVEWVASDVTRTICTAKGQPPGHCHNFVRILLPHGDRVFTCGTNAFTPKCAWRKATSLADVEWVSGVAKCPYSPHHNSTALISSGGDLYTATVMDFQGRDAAIYRIMGPAPHLRTVQYDPRWLHEPDFVAAFEVGDFIYFFFREIAIEYSNCGKAIYARVARVCKSDTGGRFLLEDNWTSFRKARLNCSMPGNVPFYFNELQAVVHKEDEKLFYGIFTTPESGLAGSAVCVYHHSAVEEAFAGPYKHQEESHLAWSRQPNLHPEPQCGSGGGDKREAAPQRHQLIDAQKYQMMDLAVQPTSPSPALILPGDRWRYLAVTTVPGKHHQSHTVYHVGSSAGTVAAYHAPSNASGACMLHQLTLPRPLAAMQLSAQQDALFLATDTEVIRIPTHQCKKYNTKRWCLAAQDPHCGWDSKHRVCRPFNGHSRHWQQDVTQCPSLEVGLAGGWGAWGAWGPCPVTGPAQAGDQCLCRHRACDSPKPQPGGDMCDGDSVQVTNCTAHGEWTEWSAWSGCSATCGPAVRSRHRACGDPQPRYGGRLCVGPSVDEQPCYDNQHCRVEVSTTPEPVGEWSQWLAWSVCSARCAGGFRSRRRVCDSGVCVGNDHQWEKCNDKSCPEVRKASPWTEWHLENATGRDYIQSRHRVVCRASVSRPGMLRMGQMKTDRRLCRGDSCGGTIRGGAEVSVEKSVAPVETGVWGRWSGWSECDAMCGGGTQWRERQCEGGQGCDGHGQVARQCNVHPCQGQWSCWGAWTSCSVSCGLGKQMRRRHCEAAVPGQLYTIPCDGQHTEQMDCMSQHCPDGWDEWTLWSVCAPDNTQKRKRVCLIPFPEWNQCTGTAVENRMCLHQVEEEPTVKIGGSKEASVGGGWDKPVQIYHLVIVGIAGFLLGGLVCVGLFMYCQRVRRVRYHIPPSTMTRQEVKQNIYSSPSQLSLGTPYIDNALNNTYYSLSKKKDPQKMTVNEATLKRNSLMRTNLSLAE